MVRIPAALSYRVVSLFVVGFDIPVSTSIGPGLIINHGMGLVVHNQTVIGSNVSLRQCTTFGSKSGTAPPTVGDNADFGANCVVLGPVTIGPDAVVGAGSVVISSVAKGDVVAGNPARVIRAAAHVGFAEVAE
jgi:serine acetyltransferase